MIYLIAAYDRNKTIGLNGKMPWHIPSELKRFKDLTMGNIVIMGRVTYESIGHPLVGRQTVIITKNENYTAENCIVLPSLHRALHMFCGKDIFIAGGESIYKHSIHLADKMFITEIDGRFKGDRFFPQFDEKDFDKCTVQTVDGKIPYKYVTYTLKRP